MFPVYQNYKSHTIALSHLAPCLTPYGGGLFSHTLSSSRRRRKIELSDEVLNAEGVSHASEVITHTT